MVFNEPGSDFYRYCFLIKQNKTVFVDILVPHSNVGERSCCKNGNMSFKTSRVQPKQRPKADKRISLKVAVIRLT